MGMLPGKNVFQISFRTRWHGFRLYCGAKLCQEVNALLHTNPQIFIYFSLLLYFTLNLSAQPFQITKERKTDSSLSLTVSLFTLTLDHITPLLLAL